MLGCVYKAAGSFGLETLDPLFGLGKINFDEAAPCRTHPDPHTQKITLY